MKNKNQMLFFILSVIAAAALLLFLFQQRRTEHAYTAKLQQEAMSEADSSGNDTVSTDAATVTAAPQNTADNGSTTPGGVTGMVGDTQSTTSTASQSPETTEKEDTAAPQIRLKTNVVTLHVGDTFKYMDYIASMTDDKDDQHALTREIELDGSVDTSKAGNYTVTYTVRDSSGKLSNRETLKVTVQ